MLSLGISVNPGDPEALSLARRADELGFDLVGIQDHPYQERFLDTFMLLATVLAATERITAFPDVANLPLRPPAMLAKEAATLDVLSGGRFELGLGAGGFWDGIAAMGGPRRTPGESVDALEEAIHIIRAFWRGEKPLTFEGKHYSVHGLHPGPRPAHEIGIWVGAYKPRMLELTGRLGDGWIPSLGYAPPEQIPALRDQVDAAAERAGRDPGAIRRLYNVPLGDMPAEAWSEQLVRFRDELGFDTVVLWPESREVVERFAAEVLPEFS